MLRAVEPSDVDFLFLLESELDIASAGFGTVPVSRQMISEYVRNYTADIFESKELRLIIVDAATGQAAGTVDIADFNPRDRRGFVGIAVAPAFRGRGLALDALNELCSLAYSELGMHQLAAVVAYDNEASRRLFEKAGFRQCGQLRSWVRRGASYCDAAIYQRLLIP